MGRLRLVCGHVGGFLNPLLTIGRGVDRAIRVLGRAIAWFALGMTLATVLIVVLRYGFAIGAIALQEAVLYMHGLLFMLGLSYTLQSDGHVRVDLLYSRLSRRRQHVVNILGHVVFLLPLCMLIMATSIDYVRAAWAIREGSQEVGGLPGLYLLKTVIPVAAGALALQSLADLVKLLQALYNDA